MSSLLRCPVCYLGLVHSGSRYHCHNNHSFDIARQGFVNLLLSHQKKTKDPGDNKEMVMSRRAVMDQGLFNGVSERLNQLVRAYAHSTSSGVSAQIIDAGCGEGFYLSRLREDLAQAEVASDCVGIDISRHAIGAAAQRNRAITWVVASVVDLPILDQSSDHILSVFAPFSASELYRVARPGCYVYLVVPEAEHLYSLRELVYGEARKHRADKLVLTREDGFAAIDDVRVQAEVELSSSATVMDFLKMTPYFWVLPPQRRQELEAAAPMRTTIDVRIMVLRRI